MGTRPSSSLPLDPGSGRVFFSSAEIFVLDLIDFDDIFGDWFVGEKDCIFTLNLIILRMNLLVVYLM